MPTRIPVSKKLRFEVFKRDSFTCQYCGQKAPDVVLEVDHIEPLSEGGETDILNLITACKSCNRGKSNIRLTDAEVLNKKRKQLELLQERREQMEAMFEWQKDLLDLEQEAITRMAELWRGYVPGYYLNDSGMNGLRGLMKNFGVDEIIAAMYRSTTLYLRFDRNGLVIQESAQEALNRIGGLCVTNRREREIPGSGKIYYIRGILRNRLSYIDEKLCFRLMLEALKNGCSIDDLRDIALSAHSWTAWKNEITQYTAAADYRESEEEE